MIKKISISSFILIFSTLSIFSQESISKDVKVVSNYAPVVSEATKISLLPQLDDTISTKPTFEYKIASKRMDAEFVTQPISPASMTKEKTYYAPKSLAKVGIGNYTLGFGEIYYNILQSDKYAAAISFDHLSSAGHLKLSNDSLVSAPLNLTNGAINARRFYKGKTLGFDLNFNRIGTTYYGLQTLRADKLYYLDSKNSTTTSGSELQDITSQRHSTVDATISLVKSEDEEKNDSYSSLFRFSNYSNKSGVSENTLHLEGDYKHFVENFYIAATGSLEYNGLTSPATTSTLYNYTSSDRTTFTLQPVLGFRFSRTEVELGLRLTTISGDSIDKNTYIGPHLIGSINLAEGIITTYGGVKTRVNTNNYREIANENNFIAPDLYIQPSSYGITLLGGVKGNFSSKTSFLAQVDYSSFTNEHFYVNKFYRTTDPTNTTITQEYDYSNRFGTVYDDGTLLSVYGEFIVKPNELLYFMINGRYNSWKLDSQLKAWHKPETELGFKTIVKPWEGWKISADVTAIGKRYAYDPKEIKELKSIVDLSLAAEYQYNQRWMFFGGAYNLLGNKYYKWNEYPTHSVNVRLGVGLTF